LILFSWLLDLIFPPKCIFCRKVLENSKIGVCPACELKYSGGVDPVPGKFFRKCSVALTYEGQVRAALLRFKFRDMPGYGATFGRILADTIRKELPDRYDLITWVPVSPKRLKQRGYDQAMLLGKAAALELGDVAVGTLQKPQNNPAQSSLESAKDRKSNVRGVYTVKDPELVREKRILLIDDVVTTGATLEEASRTLLRAGAKSVVCAALAHPVKSNIQTKEEST
jgi:ComF family protein